MKVLVATGVYPPSIGGPATHAKLIEAELPKHGISVTILSFDTVRHLPKIIRHIVYIYKLFTMRMCGDFIYALDPVSVGLPALIVATLTGKKMILRVGGDYAWEQATGRFGILDNLDVFTDQKKYPFVIRIMKYIQYFVANRSFQIIVPSLYLKHIVTRWGVDNNKINVAHNSFDGVSVPIESRESIRSTLRLDGIVVLSIGRLIPLKGFQKLIDACQNLPDTYKLLLIGDGPLWGELQTYISTQRLQNRVTLLPACSKEQLYGYIKAADVFILNTAAEGFSNVLLEVMSIGTPVITTNSGGNIELVVNKKNGLLITHNDIKEMQEAIQLMCTNPTMRATYITEAKKTLEKFSKQQLIANIIAVFKKIP